MTRLTEAFSHHREVAAHHFLDRETIMSAVAKSKTKAQNCLREFSYELPEKFI